MHLRQALLDIDSTKCKAETVSLLSVHMKVEDRRMVGKDRERMEDRSSMNFDEVR